jgi:hypothetical protein
MGSTLAAPGRALVRLSYDLQRPVESATRIALTDTEGLPDGFEQATHLAIGVAHGLIGTATGVVGLLGGLEQFATDGETRHDFMDYVKNLTSHAGSVTKNTGSAGASFFSKDPAYVLGDFITAAIPAAAVFAVTRNPWLTAATAAGTMAAVKASPNLPPVLNFVPPRKS